MIKIKLIGYHFQNCPGFCVERPTGSGDYLLLYLRRPTEIMKDGHYIKVPENTFILYERINLRFTGILNQKILMTVL